MSVILVTGASTGIGLAAARCLRAAGETVVGISRSGREGTEVADLSTEDGVREAVAIARRHGPIRGLVLNAATGSAQDASVGELTTEGWRNTMAINLDSPFMTMREAWPDLTSDGAGRIVMVASTAATYGEAGTTAYSASKAGLLGMMRVVAQDGAPHGLTCNAVLPGWVRTEMSERSAAATASRTDRTTDEVWAERSAAYAAGRVVDPEEVGEVIAFLCSRAASGVSGEEVRVALGGVW
ncbi:MAG: SDR family NAD(P)-dependent oxidoreductase [Actinobacteria bacterium]|nr:SDR family NAD(P)-dependent oxidoreductase [Actinomycetota bacterium]